MVKQISNEDGFVVTEGVQLMLDTIVNTLDAGSGFFDYREWCAIRQVAWALGLEPDVFSTGYFPDKERARAGWPDPSAPLTDEPAGVRRE